jgi:hypothetical protein
VPGDGTLKPVIFHLSNEKPFTLTTKELLQWENPQFLLCFAKCNNAEDIGSGHFTSCPENPQFLRRVRLKRHGKHGSPGEEERVIYRISMRSERIENIAPKLTNEQYEITSSESDTYNCIGWALYDTQQWWWYTPKYGCYWLPGVLRNNTRATVAKIFEIHGYRQCESSSAEPGFEKIALYEHPKYGIEHVTRQLETGRWTSKIGEWEDIEHETARSLEGSEYGLVVVYMKRPFKRLTADS